MVQIAPSIASGPLTNLRGTIRLLEKTGASIIHFDVEDGNFVPEMNLGTKVIKELRPLTTLPFDVHLMMDNPEWIIPGLADMGVDSVSVHYEACRYPRRVLQLITKQKMKAGLAFNPATEIPNLDFCSPYLSFIVVLSTEPEENNPAYLPAIMNKIRVGKSKEYLKDLLWVADGGISAANVCDAVEAGADILVIGRGVFIDGKIEDNMRAIKQAINKIPN